MNNITTENNLSLLPNKVTPMSSQDQQDTISETIAGESPIVPRPLQTVVFRNLSTNVPDAPVTSATNTTNNHLASEEIRVMMDTMENLQMDNKPGREMPQIKMKHMVYKQSVSSTVGNCVANLYLFSLVVLLICVCFALPIAMFVMTAKYKNEITCDSFMSIATWMYVQASAFTFLICGGAILYVFLEGFILAWTIVGSKLFWGDCSHLEPAPFNTLMWIVLIISYIQIVAVYKSTKSTE